MEINININQHILDWLASMGYTVSGMPREVVEGMFLREARQWELAPERLEELVMEQSFVKRGYATPALSAREA